MSGNCILPRNTTMNTLCPEPKQKNVEDTKRYVTKAVMITFYAFLPPNLKEVIRFKARHPLYNTENEPTDRMD
jgi:hypothetical protein